MHCHAFRSDAGSDFSKLRAALRSTLLGGAAIGALVLAGTHGSQAGPGPCTPSGTTITCTGDQSAGVSFTSIYDTVIVNSLTTAITPAARGVVLGVSSGAGTINVDTGTYGITTTANRGIGIHGYNTYGGNVGITNAGNISTTGASADAIFGNNRYNGEVSISSTGDISTMGPSSIGVRGYVGGTGNVVIESTGNIVTVGTYSQGLHGRIGTSGDITITSTGNITTGDNVSSGIYASSRTGNVSITSSGNINTAGVRARGISGDTRSGDVTIVSTGDVMTTNNQADGIRGYVRGAGDINITSTGNVTTTGGGTGIESFIFGGGAYSGDMTIVSTGDITTTSGGSAIYGQLFGNGDLAITSNGTISTVGTHAFGVSGTVAIDGNITISNTGNIATTGQNADALRAVAQGDGNVTITSSGDATVGGAYAHGVRLGVSAGSTATVNLQGGNVQGGSATGAGVYLGGVAGVTNQINITGTTTLSSLAGRAIAGMNVPTGHGDTTINNSGTLNTITNGDIILGAGTNAFNNRSGATFNSGQTVNLGTGNLFTNSGTLSPGGANNIATTTITGDFVQTASGILGIDIDPANAMTDLISVTGTANLAGTVQVNAFNQPTNSQTFTVLSAAGGVTDNGLTLMSSPAVRLSITYPNANDVVLESVLDFADPDLGLNSNQAGLGDVLNEAQNNGQGGLAPILTALLDGSLRLSDYKRIIQQLLPELFLDNQSTTQLGIEQFSTKLLSCGQPGTGNDFIAEGQCTWGRMEVRTFNRNSTNGSIGYDEYAQGFSMGAQGSVAPNWYLGGAVGLEVSDVETDTGADSDALHLQAGTVLKYVDGPLFLATGISGGISSFETNRRVNTGGLALTASSDHDTLWVGGHVRAAWLIDRGHWYVKPLVDIDVTYLDRDGFTEEGGGAANLTVDGDQEANFAITPAIEFGGAVTVNNMVIKPFVKTGVSFYSEDDYALTARFANAPGGTGSFTTSTEIDDVVGELEAGVTLFDLQGTSLTLGYEGRLGENSEGHGGFLKGRLAF